MIERLPACQWMDPSYGENVNPNGRDARLPGTGETPVFHSSHDAREECATESRPFEHCNSDRSGGISHYCPLWLRSPGNSKRCLDFARHDKVAARYYLFPMPVEAPLIDAEDLKSRARELRRFL
jgi:hypothetical protein